MRLRWVTLLVVGTMLGCGSNSDNGGGGGVGGASGGGQGGNGGGGGGSTPSCTGGSVTSDGELQAFADCTELSAALDVSGNAVTSVNLPKLQRTSNSIIIHDVDELTAISLPALVEAGDLYVDGAAKLTTLDLSALERVKGDLWLGSRTVVSRPLPALDVVKLPALRSVGKQLHVVEVQATELTAPLLESTGALTVSASFLTALAFPALTSVGGPLVIDQNRTLGHIDLGAVTAINGGLFVRANGRFSTATDRHLDLHALPGVSGRVEIAGNGLYTLQLDALADVSGQVALTGNDILELRVPALTTIGGDLTVAHNSSLPPVLQLPSLATIGGIVILGTRWNAGACAPTPNRDVPSSYVVALPALTTAHGLAICDERGLTDVSAPKLPSLQYSIAVAAAAELTSLHLDGMSEIGNRLIVIDNPELTTLVEAVTAVKGKTAGTPAVTVQRNPKLGCRAAALVAAAGDRGVAINGNAATCAMP